jgi:hypothetical protein
MDKNKRHGKENNNKNGMRNRKMKIAQMKNSDGLVFWSILFEVFTDEKILKKVNMTKKIYDDFSDTDKEFFWKELKGKA